MTKATVKLKRWIQGRRLGPYYAGICTRTQRLAILNSHHGTYCAWHRFRLRRELRFEHTTEEPDD